MTSQKLSEHLQGAAIVFSPLFSENFVVLDFRTQLEIKIAV
jgi:hypothetical protein